MSLDKSLKSKDTLQRHRNVLTRAERIFKLKDIGTWADGSSPFGLPKVAHRKAAVGKKEKAEQPKAEATAAAPEEAAAKSPPAKAAPKAASKASPKAPAK